MNAFLQTALVGAAAGQVCIACLNCTLIRSLRWKEELTRVPLLMREVFHVHVWFISITLLIFAVLTCRFSGEMAAGSQPVYRWLACAIGVFWGSLPRRVCSHRLAARAVGLEMPPGAKISPLILWLPAAGMFPRARLAYTA